jgi:hypothetical protein
MRMKQFNEIIEQWIKDEYMSYEDLNCNQDEFTKGAHNVLHNLKVMLNTLKDKKT